MKQPIVITGGRIVPAAGEAIEVGVLVLRDGVIAAVGTDVAVPDDATVIDATGKWVLPGFIDAHTHMGIHEEIIETPGADNNETSSPSTPGLRALDGTNISDAAFATALSAGVTTVSVKPGSGNVFGGQTAVLKTAGGRTIDEQTLSATASIKTALGENPKMAHGASGEKPVTRMGIAHLIRQSLEDARGYAARRDAARDAGETFDVNLDNEALSRLLSGELRWDVHAHRADDIATALRLADEFSLRLVLQHGTGAQPLAEIIADRGVPVAVGPLIGAPAKQELSENDMGTPAKLAAAGVQIALVTDHPEIPIEMLPVQAMLAIREGLPWQTALEAVTVNAAAMLGVGERVGALAPGMDADVVIWSADPFSMEGRVERVFIGGVELYRSH